MSAEMRRVKFAVHVMCTTEAFGVGVRRLHDARKLLSKCASHPTFLAGWIRNRRTGKEVKRVEREYHVEEMRDE